MRTYKEEDFWGAVIRSHVHLDDRDQVKAVIVKSQLKPGCFIVIEAGPCIENEKLECRNQIFIKDLGMAKSLLSDLAQAIAKFEAIARKDKENGISEEGCPLPA